MWHTFFYPVCRFDPELRDMSQLPKGPMMRAMATCHSLTIIEGEIMGDPLDLIMFNATDWVSIFCMCVINVPLDLVMLTLCNFSAAQ
jgi:hypothetical protein